MGTRSRQQNRASRGNAQARHTRSYLSCGNPGFIINLIGLGLGPQAVGILSDLLHGSFGVESLRYALLWVVVVFAAWSVVHYALAARSIRSDLEAKNSLGVEPD